MRQVNEQKNVKKNFEKIHIVMAQRMMDCMLVDVKNDMTEIATLATLAALFALIVKKNNKKY